MIRSLFGAFTLSGSLTVTFVYTRKVDGWMAGWLDGWGSSEPSSTLIHTHTHACTHTSEHISRHTSWCRFVCDCVVEAVTYNEGSLSPWLSLGTIHTFFRRKEYLYKVWCNLIGTPSCIQLQRAGSIQLGICFHTNPPTAKGFSFIYMGNLAIVVYKMVT